jgi:ATP-dependent DNA helicase RecQ
VSPNHRTPATDRSESAAYRARLFAALYRALEHGAPTEAPGDVPARTWDPGYPVWRLLHAWYACGPGGEFGPDLIILLRQVVRWHGVALAIPDLHDSVSRGLTAFGDVAGLRVSHGHLEAVPFAPAWLDGTNARVGIDDAPTVRRPDERVQAEAYLARLGFDQWNSAAQKEGVWRALMAPPRSTTLVALPTGAGKSLCFQAITAWTTGLVVVVVPTVALAIDHWQSARQVFGADASASAMYYAADDPSQPAEHVLHSVHQGGCRLLFTSPEACVSGRLRPVLAESARSGRLDALVIDEAHLADSWGMYFRVDFQVLAALRRQWLTAPSARLRTLLLSATFTPECRLALRHLFADSGEEWAEVSSQRLRPELSYFAHVFSSRVDRELAVTECVWRLPRPSILYTTTRADARAWLARLTLDGFSRVACFDGNTPSVERRQLLERWRTNQIDLMVATSAFGMGVDKDDVRTVIHACLPEDLNRYYQEVGRGGRDGASTVCFLLPLFPRDKEVADGLGPRLLRPDTLARRWTSLWDSHEATDQPNTWLIRTDAVPSNLFGTDTGRRNIAWNKRLLLQLARAGLLDLLDVRRATPLRLRGGEQVVNGGRENEDDDGLDGGVDIAGLEATDVQFSEVATVRLRFPPNAADVDLRIENVRATERESMSRGLGYMMEYVNGAACIGRILRRLYGADSAIACGACPTCREAGRSWPCPPLPVPRAVHTTATRMVIADVPSPLRDDQRRRFQGIVRRLFAAGVRRFVCQPDGFLAVLRTIDAAFEAVPRALYRVDAWNPVHGVSCATQESLAVLHVGSLSESALQISVGAQVVHLITAGTPHLDLQKRRPLEQDGAPYYASPDFWAPEA